MHDPEFDPDRLVAAASYREPLARLARSLAEEAAPNAVGRAVLRQRLLQFLQWQKRRSGQPGHRWVLKAPHHLHYMDVFKIFPDAKVVQSHRDPVETIPSPDVADPREVGRQWASKFARGMQRTMAVRARLPADRFLDLWFEDTVRQPLAESGRVYAFLGMELTPEARSEMAQWQEFNRREHRPPHEYMLEQFGLTRPGLEQQLRAYRERFILARPDTGGIAGGDPAVSAQITAKRHAV